MTGVRYTTAAQRKRMTTLLMLLAVVYALVVTGALLAAVCLLLFGPRDDDLWTDVPVASWTQHDDDAYEQTCEAQQ